MVVRFPHLTCSFPPGSARRYTHLPSTGTAIFFQDLDLLRGTFSPFLAYTKYVATYRPAGRVTLVLLVNRDGCATHWTLPAVPGSYALIQALINAAADGDTVLVAPGPFFVLSAVNLGGFHCVENAHRAVFSRRSGNISGTRFDGIDSLTLGGGYSRGENRFFRRMVESSQSGQNFWIYEE